MFSHSFLKPLSAFLLCSTMLLPQLASAEGIVLGGTRLVYPMDAKQVTLSVRNSSKENSYLVQSWAENSQGVKSTDFIITPPYMSVMLGIRICCV